MGAIALSALLAAQSLAALSTASPGAAACQTQSVQTYELGVMITSQIDCPASSTGSSQGSEADYTSQQAASATDFVTCVATAVYLGVEPTACNGEEQQTEAVTPGLVVQAFRRIELSGSVLQVQPPNGRTLVNFATNFYTEPEDLTRTVTLLGQQVELRIYAVEYTWRFDDGVPLTTTSPGARHPDLEVTHDYRRKGAYAPSVDTTYGADWRVAGRPWQRVASTVTIQGDAVALEAVEARPTLVS